MGFLDQISDPGKDERRRAREIMEGVRLPESNDLALQLQRLVQTGELRPEEVETILQGPSAYQEITTDPRLRSAQTDTLGRFREIADAGGLDARAKLGLQDALDAQATETRGQEGAIAANFRARGIGGSDLESLQRLIAQQGAAQRGSRAALEQAAIGQERRDNALTQGANLAGSIRSADFGEASAKANAQDAISRYNAANAQDVAGQNVRARNVAQAGNLDRRQTVSDANVGIGNEEARYKAQLPLTLYGLQRGAAQDRANAQLNEAQSEQARNDRYAQLAASAAMAFAASDERVKEDVAPIDSEAILRDLSGFTYSYKGDPEQTPQAGVMAQDMERTPLAGAVSEDEGGVKRIDYGAMGFESGQEGSVAMGLLADLNRRIEELEAAKGGAPNAR